MRITRDNSDRISIRFDDELKARAAAISKKEYRPITSIIHEALDKYCTEKGFPRQNDDAGADLAGLDQDI